MDIIKDLPKVFEEFAEQRKNSFLGVKKLKDAGIPVIGSYCTYFPQEIATAMGAASVSLCSTSDETIPVAEKDLPKNLCPLIKSSYGFAITDKCPFFYFSDVVVGETTCDGKKKMYEYLSEFKNVLIMELPNSQSEAGLKLWRNEIVRFKEHLEKTFGCEITEEQIRHAVHVANQRRTALKNLYEIMKNDPAPIDGSRLYNVLYGTSFRLDEENIPAEINALRERIMTAYAQGEMEPKKKRILLTGCPSGGAGADRLTLSKEAIAHLEEQNRLFQERLDQDMQRKARERIGEEDSGDGMLDALAERLKVMQKCQKIASRIMAGDKVPPQDEMYLMQNDPTAYKLAMAARKIKKDPKEWESEADKE